MATTGPTLAFRTGNRMVAEGAVRAGCRFFAGYPTPPAAGIYNGIVELLQARGDVALGAPDEISALALCVGASMRGVRAMTATSGPGWSLMIEAVQYAVMTETPVVIAVVQRLGPSTGGATQGGQGDVLFTEFCTSGGYTIPMLCPSTARECYELTMTAFSWSEMLRTPVVLLSDKEVGTTSESIDYDELVEPAVVERVPVDPPAAAGARPATSRGTYAFDRPADVPRFAPVGGDVKVTATGSIHDRHGTLKTNAPETLEVLWHLEAKIRARADELVRVQFDPQVGARTLVLSYGITARAMRQAVRNVRQRGGRAASLAIQGLFPVPENALRQALRGMTRVVIAEENMSGQYRSVLAPVLNDVEVIGINKIGSMITPEEIADAIY